MAPKPRPVTAKALQALLTRIGSASSGTKDVLYQRFKKDVAQPGLHAGNQNTKNRSLRIISIDMGIKNLAYCDASVTFSRRNAMSPTMDIIRWDKLNLVDAARVPSRLISAPNPVEKDVVDEDEDADPYSLTVLSETAYRFITETVLSGAPDIILIERQRWRSASSAAIQQWTVRVNTLEAMLWAVLKTILIETRNSRTKALDAKRNYEIYGVDPKRVGQYWLSQHAQAIADRQGVSPSEIGIEDLAEGDGNELSNRKVPRSKAEKKAKIALLRSWLATEPASTASSMPDSAPTITFTIGQGAVVARQALSLTKVTKSKNKKMEAARNGAVQEKDMTKLDDITDCFLQGAAWVAWEANREQLHAVWKRKRNANTNLPELDDDTLKAMIEVTGQSTR
ncbi:mitochondrial resolvase Ydc2 [Ampelomyces quisqualis]|uniref:Mitochondrial resolvase Ydc2 n=1 Tax=Ampelomyces quisqualis TaxID=50730 RepID=A0A6A5R4G8_AMPQU|nr:mitochondrial resolvase Ydc2 [Ampelomyces quisqualis]